MQDQLLDYVALQMSGGFPPFKIKVNLYKKTLDGKDKEFVGNQSRAKTGYWTMKPLTTMRIQSSLDCDLCNQGSNECYALNHIRSDIQSVEQGLHETVALAIYLGKSQFDLAVEQTSVSRIKEHFTDLTQWRLLICDPLFAAEFGRSSSETAFIALKHMKGQYDLVASSIYVSNDQRLINWFKTELNQIEGLLEQYRQQCINLS
ncbi:hypothetical protein N7452_004146 [Penicillium brevicompactum]|uniref:Uncharacterized protein n=1 Tax=Penicillium brevicompactum TaxID=5074 RepID=A0A9W9QV17_PENBR|nr:hypothetical protein N7452_004146 [Penicillium brevicompactum]